MKKPEDKFIKVKFRDPPICHSCGNVITGSYTILTFDSDREDYIMCDHCYTYFKQLMDME